MFQGQCSRSTKEAAMKLLHVGAVLVMLGVTTLSSSASAMPIANLQAQTAANVEQVRWVCGPYRCWWRQNLWGPGQYAFYGGPRFYGRPWGWRRWHRWL